MTRRDNEVRRRKTLATAKARGRVTPYRGNLGIPKRYTSYYSRSMVSAVNGARWYREVGLSEFDCQWVLVINLEVVATIYSNESCMCYNKYVSTLMDKNRTNCGFDTMRDAVAWAEDRVGGAK